MTSHENPATFNEYREAYARMKAERDQLVFNLQELAEHVLGYFETGNGLDSIRELAEAMIK